MVRYKHLKTGNYYEVTGEGTDETNGREGTPYVAYRLVGTTQPTYYRKRSEFDQKFERTEQLSVLLLPGGGSRLPGILPEPGITLWDYFKRRWYIPMSILTILVALAFFDIRIMLVALLLLGSVTILIAKK